jgi:hypothetical protein
MDVGSRFLEILKVLSRHQVEFILVGGVAAILEGAPVSTLDLDIVVRPTGKRTGRSSRSSTEPFSGRRVCMERHP